jgi:hypothetical protein
MPGTGNLPAASTASAEPQIAVYIPARQRFGRCVPIAGPSLLNSVGPMRGWSAEPEAGMPTQRIAVRPSFYSLIKFA